MSKLITTIRASLGYSQDKEIQEKLGEILTSHDNDLEEVGYEMSTETDDLRAELEHLMNDFDERTAQRREELSEAIAEAREEEVEIEEEDE